MPPLTFGPVTSRDSRALWWRVSLPVMVPAIAVIALALSRTDARRGRYAKIGPAMVVLLLYFLGMTQGRRH